MKRWYISAKLHDVTYQMTVIFICLTHFLLRMLYKSVVCNVTDLQLHFSISKVKQTYGTLELIGTFMFLACAIEDNLLAKM